MLGIGVYEAVTRSVAIIIVVLCFPCLAFAQQAKQQKIASLKHRIPPAKPNRYRSVRDAPEWKNPFLIVEADGIEVRASGAAAKIPVSAVIGFLEKLPNRPWFYGLVVAVAENGIHTEDQNSRIKINSSELARVLREAGVKIVLVPSA